MPHQVEFAGPISMTTSSTLEQTKASNATRAGKMKTFAIPEGATKLVAVPTSDLDLRSDADIIAELRTFRPIISEKNVWAFWDKGIDAMYPSYRCTVLNWVRKLSPAGWTVRLVDMVPGSPNNVAAYMDEATWLPMVLIERRMDGGHAAQHASDLIRMPLLYLYGGVWMDVGNMLHTHLDDLFWSHLTAPGSPYELGLWLIPGQIRKAWGSFGNFMLAARKGCEFISRWHAGYRTVWEETGNTDATGFSRHPLLRDIGLADGMEDWNFPKEQIIAMSDYVAQMLLGDRLRRLVDVEDGWDGRQFFAQRCFMVQGLPDGIRGAIATGFDGKRQAALFTTPLVDDAQAKADVAADAVAKPREAEAFVLDVLENSHMYKVYHNSAPTGLPALGDVVKLAGFRDADHRPGTFGELYRYGTVHWRSTRPVERFVPPPVAEMEAPIYATATKSVDACRDG